MWGLRLWIAFDFAGWGFVDCGFGFALGGFGLVICRFCLRVLGWGFGLWFLGGGFRTFW